MELVVRRRCGDARGSFEKAAKFKIIMISPEKRRGGGQGRGVGRFNLIAMLIGSHLGGGVFFALVQSATPNTRKLGQVLTAGPVFHTLFFVLLSCTIAVDFIVLYNIIINRLFLS